MREAPLRENRENRLPKHSGSTRREAPRSHKTIVAGSLLSLFADDIAIRGVSVVDVERGRVEAGRTVVIDEDRIASVAPTREGNTPMGPIVSHTLADEQGIPVKMTLVLAFGKLEAVLTER